MTGMAFAAWTMAHAIRWVKESFLPAPFSCLRRPSRVSTSTVRKLVAVGIERLSFMKRASVAAGPRIDLAPGGGADGGVADGRGLDGTEAPFPAIAASTSSFVTRPRGPEPWRPETSTPLAEAIRAATGVALRSPFPVVAVIAAVSGSGSADDEAGTAAPVPGAIRAT